MKKIKYSTLIIILVLLFANDGISQIRKGSYASSLEYSVGFNTGRAGDFISTPGWAGGQFTFKSFIAKNTALGMIFGYNIFAKEDENGVLELENGTISGVQARYINYLPIYANMSYYFVKNRNSKFMPYVAGNVGGMRVWQRAQLGVYLKDNDNWHFAVAPEAGFITALGRSVGMTLNARYNVAFSAGENLVGKDENSFNYVSLNLGFVYLR